MIPPSHPAFGKHSLSYKFSNVLISLVTFALLAREFVVAVMTTSLFVWAYVTAYVTFGIGILSSLARFYSRGLALRLWGWDDTASCLVMAWGYHLYGKYAWS